MKKVLVYITLAFFSWTSQAQTSSGTWNNKTATYVNTAHQITWQLIDEWTWTGRPILTEGTLLKVRNDDTHILVSLSVQKDDSFVGDIWDCVSDYESPVVVSIKKVTAKQNGMVFLGTKATKSRLSGIHAVKTRTDMKKYYAEYNATVHGIEIMQILYRRGRCYTATVTALSVLEEDIPEFERIATEIFNGFIIR